MSSESLCVEDVTEKWGLVRLSRTSDSHCPSIGVEEIAENPIATDRRIYDSFVPIMIG